MDATLTFSLFQAFHPCRALDWRWQRATALVASGRHLLSRRDDIETLVIARYLHALSRCQDDRQRARVQQRWPALHAAERLQGRGGWRRWEVEARLLCGQSDDEVSAHVGLKPEAIAWFETAYFCVRDRLQARDWIAARAIGVGLMLGVDSDVAMVLKRCGFYGGAAVLDVVIAVARKDGLLQGAGPRPDDMPAIDYQLAQSIRLMLAVALLPSSMSLSQLANLHMQLRRGEGRARFQSVAEIVAKAIEQTLDEANLVLPEVVQTVSAAQRHVLTSPDLASCPDMRAGNRVPRSATKASA